MGKLVYIFITILALAYLVTFLLTKWRLPIDNPVSQTRDRPISPYKIAGIFGLIFFCVGTYLHFADREVIHQVYGFAQSIGYETFALQFPRFKAIQEYVITHNIQANWEYVIAMYLIYTIYVVLSVFMILATLYRFVVWVYANKPELMKRPLERRIIKYLLVYSCPGLSLLMAISLNDYFYNSAGFDTGRRFMNYIHTGRDGTFPLLIEGMVFLMSFITLVMGAIRLSDDFWRKKALTSEGDMR